MRRNNGSHPITPRAVLFESSRHNLQASTSSHGAAYSKGKNSTRKTYVGRTLNKIAEKSAKKPIVPLRIENEESSSLCSSGQAEAVEAQASPKCPEILDLKQRLRTAHFQIAEVVAQSAILVRDIQGAANKEIANVMQHSSTYRLEKKGSSLCEDPISSFNEDTRKDLYCMGAETSEQELASTQQELADCKLMLAEMRRQLERTSYEKERLEMYLKSSIQTSFELQDTLMKQRSVLRLELLAAEDRYRNAAALLVQSARKESKYLQEQLNVALLSKVEAGHSLQDCNQLLCGAQREFTSSALVKQQCCFQQILQDNLQQLQNSRKQVKAERDNLYEAHTENGITWTVLECVWEGAAVSLLQSGGSQAADQDSSLETPGLYSKKSKKLSVQTPKGLCSYSTSEEPTPLSSKKGLHTPRSILREDGLRRSRSELSPWEDVLRKSLMKSEYEVEILGDRVVELRIILEKVTTLLDCISKSSVTEHETKLLMRRIIEQLKAFENVIATSPEEHH